MIRIGILGDIGSGKSYVAKSFGYPVFNADKEVSKLYRKDKNIFLELKKKLPKFIHTFPIDKNEIIEAILINKTNLNKIVKIIHAAIRIEMKRFLKKNEKRKIIILDIPLLLENKINKRGDILIFVKSKKKDILRKLKKRSNFNQKLHNRFKKLQLPLDYKLDRSNFIIKNNFTKKSVKKDIKYILEKIL
tara:strand:+ start:1016 stop:1585 length:570 start_codon:yes stop_codon:yes gene_type:complete